MAKDGRVLPDSCEAWPVWDIIWSDVGSTWPRLAPNSSTSPGSRRISAEARLPEQLLGSAWTSFGQELAGIAVGNSVLWAMIGLPMAAGITTADAAGKWADGWRAACSGASASRGAGSGARECAGGVQERCSGGARSHTLRGSPARPRVRSRASWRPSLTCGREAQHNFPSLSGLTWPGWAKVLDVRSLFELRTRQTLVGDSGGGESPLRHCGRGVRPRVWEKVPEQASNNWQADDQEPQGVSWTETWRQAVKIYVATVRGGVAYSALPESL